MPRRVDLLRAVGEAVISGDGTRIRRLLTPDASIDSIPGGGSLSVDRFVDLHENTRPFMSWEIQKHEPLDDEGLIVKGTATMRTTHGIALRQFVYRCYFRGSLLHRVHVHASVVEAREAHHRERESQGTADPTEPS